MMWSDRLATGFGAMAVALSLGGAAVAAGLDAAQKHRAEQLVSIFENGIPQIQYGYAEALGDGRGITAGRAGFTTGTGDALMVLERYAALSPEAPIVAYLPELERLAPAEDGDTSGLDGFIEAWGAAAEDPLFLRAQDEVHDELYYNPASGYADEVGLEMPLSRAAIYDAILMHGDGDDPDGLWAMMDRASEEVGGYPSDGVDEAEWLRAFLMVRHAVLEHATDPDTREEWAEAADRAMVWLALLDAGNFDLDGPIRMTLGDYEIDIE
jgi:chitosanase